MESKKLTAAPSSVEAEIPEARRSDAARERTGWGRGLDDCVEAGLEGWGRGPNALRRKILGVSG